MLILSELKKLHDKGLALIYLRPKSKRPFELKWTKGARKPWAELESSFERTYNVGVRLGEPSKLPSGMYLGAIDCDVKSKSRQALREMNDKLRELGIDLTTAPIVTSGRGNGSKHIYVQTDTPMVPKRFARSTRRVKVLMPGEGSKPHSKEELEGLTEAERASGYRIRPAWEISLMGTGQQTVLPPSQHPDTGFAYAWASPLTVKYLPRFKVPKVVKTTTVSDDEEKAQAFKPEDVDLYASRLDLHWIGVIEHGAPQGERSEALLSVAMALCRAGLTDNQILSVLSHPDHAISEAAYERRQGRVSAVAWLEKYTLTKARYETDIMRRFENKPVMERLTPKEVQDVNDGIEQDIKDAGYWMQGARGGPKPHYEALMRAFEHGHPFKTIADMKAVYVFRDTHYVDLTPIEIRGFAEQMLKPKPEEKFRAEFHNKVLANNIERREFFSRTTEGKLNFKNGILSVGVSDELEAHSAKYGFRGVLPYAYDPEARCPVFEKWIKSIMLEDRNLTAVLQEYMGYIVRGGEYKYHKALWLGGVGRNGKSTFIDLLKALIGAGNFSVISIKTLMGDKFAGADLDGKIANFSEETSPQELADSGPFKNLTGDGDMFVQKKYGDPYNFRNRAKLIMTYNRIPELKDLSSGMLSRPLIIPFEKIIAEEDQDRDIKRKLFAELPGIFNYALRGWHRLEQQGGFTKSVRSEEALQSVREESDSVYQWVENHVRVTGDGKDKAHRKLASELYSEYCLKERYPVRESEFYRRIADHPTMGNRRKRYEEGMTYLGIRVV